MNAPTPTALKILRGNPGHRPLTPDEPQPASPLQDPPDYLDSIALDEWERVYPELHRLGLLTLVDRTALAAYCVKYSEWRQALKEIEAHGRTITTPNGLLQTSPHVTQARDALSEMMRIAKEFGFTPASRARLSVQPAPVSEDTEDLLQ